MEGWYKELWSESKLLQHLWHPCLVCMVGVIIHPTMSLVLEEAPQGSLQCPLLYEQRAFSRIVMHCCSIAIQLAYALCFLHSINIIFRDLKADNVLVWTSSDKLKIYWLQHCYPCWPWRITPTHADPGGSLLPMLTLEDHCYPCWPWRITSSSWYQKFHCSWSCLR